jgi:uncharacterized protein with HEPN domain
VRDRISTLTPILGPEYHRISDTVIWNVVREHLPALRAAVAAIEARLEEP